MKSKATTILSLLLLVFACVAGYFAAENSRLKEALAEEQATKLVVNAEDETGALIESDEAPETTVSEEAQVTNKVGELREVDGNAQDWRQRRFEARRERAKQFLDRLQDPERRLDFIESNMGRIDQRYADFFVTLNLPVEEIEVLKTLMAEYGIVETEARMKLFVAETDEDKEAIREEMRLQQELLDGDVAAVLGDEQFAGLKTYKATLPYRNGVEEFTRSLSYTDTPVSREQSEALLNTYASVSEEFEFTENLGDGERHHRGMPTVETMQTYIEEKEIFDTMVLERASVYLEEAQLASLAERQIVQRERLARHMEFMQQRNAEAERGGDGAKSGARLQSEGS